MQKYGFPNFYKNKIVLFCFKFQVSSYLVCVEFNRKVRNPDSYRERKAREEIFKLGYRIKKLAKLNE